METVTMQDLKNNLVGIRSAAEPDGGDAQDEEPSVSLDSEPSSLALVCSILGRQGCFLYVRRMDFANCQRALRFGKFASMKQVTIIDR